jgi:arylsulfatase
MRDGKWKLVQKWRGPWELYDMEADRTELRNVIAAHPDVAVRLQGAWKAWEQRTFTDTWDGPDHTNWGADIRPRR